MDEFLCLGYRGFPYQVATIDESIRRDLILGHKDGYSEIYTSPVSKYHFYFLQYQPSQPVVNNSWSDENYHEHSLE
ncbi:hypothetical protein VCV18_009770 [Metarhizium anisopliae]